MVASARFGTALFFWRIVFFNVAALLIALLLPLFIDDNLRLIILPTT
jgi:hypothetical protein